MTVSDAMRSGPEVDPFLPPLPPSVLVQPLAKPWEAPEGAGLESGDSAPGGTT